MKKSQIDILVEINKLVQLLKGKKAFSSVELCKMFNLTERTLQRRLQHIRFHYSDLYLNKTPLGFKLIEAYPLKKANQKVNSINKTLKYRPGQQNHINTINRAIKTKHFIKLINYLPNTGKQMQNFEILPLTMLLNREPGQIVGIRANELSKNLIKTFNLGQFETVKLLERAHQINFDAKQLKFDDFGMLYDVEEKTMQFDLYLTSYSRRMLYHDFPHLKEKIRPLKDRQKIQKEIKGQKYNFDFKITLKVSQIGVLVRLTAGMLDNIIIKSDREENLENLKTDIRKVVMTGLESNFDLK